jgi:enoyl-CoA hydratase/carnithine racemase
VNGAAAGAGFSLALASDIRIAAPAASFNAAFIRLGLTAGHMSSSWLLPRLIGTGLVSELLLTGRLVEAEEALAIRLVNRVVPAGELLTTAIGMAWGICGNSPLSVRLTKQAIQTNLAGATLAAAMELENRNQALAASTDDMREAIGAFRGKRPTVYTDR